MKSSLLHGKKGAVKREIHELESCVFLNSEDGKFKKIPLPSEAQFSPIYSLYVDDFNQDGLPDLLSGGNLYAVSTQIGKYDGSYTNIFLNQGDGSFKTLPNRASGLTVKGEVREIQKIKVGDKEMLFFARNNMPLAIRELMK